MTAYNKGDLGNSAFDSLEKGDISVIFVALKLLSVMWLGSDLRPIAGSLRKHSMLVESIARSHHRAETSKGCISLALIPLIILL